MEKEKGEAILVFTPDDKEEREATRAYFGVAHFCDVVIFYKRGGATPLVFFIELKGTDVAHAIEQVESAIEAALSKIPKLKSQVRIKAIIASTGSAPALIGKAQKKFNKNGVTLLQKTVQKGNLDIRRFIN